MQRTKLTILAAVLAIGGVCTAGKGNKGGPRETPVIADVFDTPGEFQSDGQGPYLDGNGTTSHLVANGNLVVDPSDSKQSVARSFIYYFEEPVDNPVVPAFLYDPNGLESFGGRFSGKCSGDGGMPGMTDGDSKPCKVNLRVMDYNGEFWRVDFIDDPDFGGDHRLLLTCVEGDSTTCWKWTYEGSTGVLVHGRLKGKDANVPIPEGVVSMPLFMEVCDPAKAPAGCD